MPAAEQYYGEQKRDKALNEAALKHLQNAQSRFANNQAYYVGDHRRPLRVRGGVDDNVILNMVRQTVDRRVSFLFPGLPQMDADDGGLNEFIKGLWHDLGGARLAQDMAFSGAKNGQVVVKLADLGMGQLRAINLNAQNVVPFYSADDIDLVLWYEIHWKRGDMAYRQDIISPEIGGGGLWTIREYSKANRSTDWQLIGEPTWTYPFAPIVDWQHLPDPDGYIGRDEFETAGLNDVLNVVASNINKILRLHAHPRTVVTGGELPRDYDDDGNEISTEPGEVLEFPDSETRVFNVEMQSDLSASMEFMKFVRQFYYESSQVVVLPPDVDAFSSVTNFGIRSAHLSMISVNEMLRRNYGRGLVEVTRRLLAMAGVASYDATAIELKWGDPLPMDKTEMVARQKTEIEMGTLSRTDAILERGNDPAVVLARIEDEADMDAARQERQLRVVSGG